MSNTVLAEKTGAVLALTLNRPDSLNAINQELIAGVRQHLEEARSDDSVRAVTIRGTGRGFCAGGDIRGFAQMLASGDAVPSDMPDQLHAMVEDIRTLPVPVIAVIHGPCAGAGFSLIMACDLAIAADTAKFNLAYSKIALSPDGSSTYFLPRHVGMKKAAEMFFTPRTMSAAELLELGLVNRVVPEADLDSEARAMIDELAAGPTQAYARIKKLMNSTWTNNLHDQLALETRYIVESSGTADFATGISAFLAKKAPEFSGK
jgi:2-(1,2-epoxy-1,2-dihydrophenyl)acetyl-CoA isomerase